LVGIGGGSAALIEVTLVSPGVARQVPIRGDMIRLGQLLKLADVVGGGGEVKDFLASETVLVNGEPDQRRGRQLHPGDVVDVAGDQLRITRQP
jgi:ribosome-associated protein